MTKINDLPEYMRVCTRCGAKPNEATLTRSHAPRTSTAKQSRHAGNGCRYSRVYVLCEACHGRYSKLECQILERACREMILMHANFLRDDYHDNIEQKIRAGQTMIEPEAKRLAVDGGTAREHRTALYTLAGI